MPPYDAVLFDFDGVLADTEPLHFACWAAIVAPLGIRLDWATYQRIGIGNTDAGLMRLLAGMANPPVPVEVLQFKYPEKRRLFLEKALAGRLIEEPVRELLKSLVQYKLALVTSSYREEVEPLLDRAGIRELFGAMVTAGDVARAKPSPDPYLEAALRLGARAPLVIEDSDAGAESAHAAGFDVVRVRSPRDVPDAVRTAIACGRRG